MPKSRIHITTDDYILESWIQIAEFNFLESQKTKSKKVKFSFPEFEKDEFQRSEFDKAELEYGDQSTKCWILIKVRGKKEERKKEREANYQIFT